jgi:hypothetical protein
MMIASLFSLDSEAIPITEMDKKDGVVGKIGITLTPLEIISINVKYVSLDNGKDVRIIENNIAIKPAKRLNQFNVVTISPDRIQIQSDDLGLKFLMNWNSMTFHKLQFRHCQMVFWWAIK